MATGARGVIDVRGADLQQLKQAFEDPPDTPTPTATPPDRPSTTPTDAPLRVRGQLKLRMHEAPPQSDSASDSTTTKAGGKIGPVATASPIMSSPAEAHLMGAHSAESDAVATGALFDAVRFAERQRAGAYNGTFELQGVRVNQLQLAHALKGDFGLGDGRLQLDGDGFWAYEKLRADVNFAALERLSELADVQNLLEASVVTGGSVNSGHSNAVLAPTTQSKVKASGKPGARSFRQEDSGSFQTRLWSKLGVKEDGGKLKSHPLEAAALRESTGPGGRAAGASAVGGLQQRGGLGGGSTVELRHGNMVLSAEVDSRGEQVRLFSLSITGK